ncbi:MAG: hypothetical protein LCH41_13395 [Armatimonadetes bacterium]|nr:hypothetical protein [Armatimonadota bacterium]
MVAFNRICKQLLGTTQATEFKWSQVETLQRFSVSSQILTEFFERTNLRVMVLTWDIQDSRHKIANRDDRENFHRMLFHGLRRNADWHGVRDWMWFPDQKQDLRHPDIVDFLNSTRELPIYNKSKPLIRPDRGYLRILKHAQRCSKELPILGVADLFAGAVNYSHSKCDDILRALRMKKDCENGLLFEEFRDDAWERKTEQARAEIAAQIYELGKKHKQSISLESKNCLSTWPRSPRFSFWKYEPQAEYDKAPTKRHRESPKAQRMTSS